MDEEGEWGDQDADDETDDDNIDAESCSIWYDYQRGFEELMYTQWPLPSPNGNHYTLAESRFALATQVMPSQSLYATPPFWLFGKADLSRENGLWHIQSTDCISFCIKHEYVHAFIFVLCANYIDQLVEQNGDVTESDVGTAFPRITALPRVLTDHVLSFLPNKTFRAGIPKQMFFIIKLEWRLICGKRALSAPNCAQSSQFATATRMLRFNLRRLRTSQLDPDISIRVYMDENKRNICDASYECPIWPVQPLSKRMQRKLMISHSILTRRPDIVSRYAMLSRRLDCVDPAPKLSVTPKRLPWQKRETRREGRKHIHQPPKNKQRCNGV